MSLWLFQKMMRYIEVLGSFKETSKFFNYSAYTKFDMKHDLT